MIEFFIEFVKESCNFFCDFLAFEKFILYQFFNNFGWFLSIVEVIYCIFYLVLSFLQFSYLFAVAPW